MFHLRPRVIISKRMQELHWPPTRTKTVHIGLCSIPRSVSGISEIYDTVVLLALCDSKMIENDSYIRVVLCDTHDTSILIVDTFATIPVSPRSRYTLLSFLWDWWILNDIEIALCNAHFRYRGSIEYRDTRDGIVIVAPSSGIAQHYIRVIGHDHQPEGAQQKIQRCASKRQNL